MIFSVLNDLINATLLYKDKIAIYDKNEKLTFNELNEHALSTAELLLTIGIKPGDRVGICMAKSSEQVISILATLYSNAIFVPILPSLKEDSISHIVNDSGMKAIICDEIRLNEVSKFNKTLEILIGNKSENANYINIPTARQKTKNNIEFNRLGSDIAAIIYSSGSTGRPKGIMVTHRNLSDGAKIVSSYLGTNSEDRIASILSFNFDYGLNQLWQCLYTGASLHLHDFFLPNECFNFLVREKITALPLMPAIISLLFDKKLGRNTNKYDFSNIRYVCSSGGRISPEMLNNISINFKSAKFYSMYGLTEAFRSTYLPPEQLNIRPNSIGKAIPDVDILIFDENGNECKVGEVGELVHRGGCITKGYWNDPIKTSERFRHHSNYPGEILVYSGDLAFKDSEGFITFVNRKDGMLKSNGIRISPTEVEETIEKHSNINIAIAFGIENVDIGHDIIVAYTTFDNLSIDENDLNRFLNLNMARHMIPKYLVRLESMPITGNQGKIDRILVKELSMKILALNNNAKD